jgi:predicted PurR-regulated permease PerM
VKQPRRLPRSQVSLTTVFTVCAGVLIIGFSVWFVVHTLVALTLTASALMIAVALDHPVSLLERKRMRRPVAIAVVTTAALVLMAAFFLLIIPPAVSQTKQLASHVPALKTQVMNSHLYTEAQKRFKENGALGELLPRVADVLSGTAGPLLTIVGGVLNAVAAVVTIFFLAIFMLIFGGRVVEALLGEATPERRDRYRKMLQKIYNLIGGYLGGLFLICAINATLASTFLAIVGVPFFLPLGLASGFSSLVPYAGPVVMGAAITALGAVTAGLWKGVATAIYFVVYGQLEGNVLGPLVFRRTVHVNPLIVLLSIVFFSEIAGVIGAIMAVPVTAALQVVAREILRIRRERLDLAKTEMNTPTETT